MDWHGQPGQHTISAFSMRIVDETLNRTDRGDNLSNWVDLPKLKGAPSGRPGHPIILRHCYSRSASPNKQKPPGETPWISGALLETGAWKRRRGQRRPWAFTWCDPIVPQRPKTHGVKLWHSARPPVHHGHLSAPLLRHMDLRQVWLICPIPNWKLPIETPPRLVRNPDRQTLWLSPPSVHTIWAFCCSIKIAPQRPLRR